MGYTTPHGQYVDPEGGLYIGGIKPQVEGLHTGDIKDHMSQSQAGLGTQGPVIKDSQPAKPIPAPTHPDMDDA